MAIKHNYLTTAGTKPTIAETAAHEIVINEADGSLWSKDSLGAVVAVGGGSGSYVDLLTDQIIGGNKTFTERLTLDSGGAGAPTSGINLKGDLTAEGFLGFDGTDLFHIKAPDNGFRVTVPDLYLGADHEFTFTSEGYLALNEDPIYPQHAANKGYVDSVAGGGNYVTIDGYQSITGTKEFAPTSQNKLTLVDTGNYCTQTWSLGGSIGATVGFEGSSLMHFKVLTGNGLRFDVNGHLINFTTLGNITADTAPLDTGHMCNKAYVDGVVLNSKIESLNGRRDDLISIKDSLSANGLTTTDIENRIVLIQNEIDLA